MGSEAIQVKHKNILILGSDFLPRPSANGVCLYNIAKEYTQKGHNVFCIVAQEPGQKEYQIIEDIHIYRLKRAWFTSFYEKHANGGKLSRAFGKVVHLARNICMVPFYPNVAPLRSIKFYALAKKIVVKENIDIVIASFVPYETIYTALHLKKTFGDQLCCVTYYLDYLWENRYSSLARAFYNWACEHAQKKDIRYLDYVIIPITSKVEFESQYGIHHNVKFLELPVYVRENGIPMENLPFTHESIDLAFVGTLNTWNRSPERLLKLLLSVKNKLPNVKLHLWGDITNTKEIIAQYPALVEYHGYTESKYIPTILQSADWVVNISNKRDHHLVPSKIFQLFASGKPILNYMFNRSDVSIPYFQRYENTYWVYDDEADNEKTIDSLVEALKKQWLTVNADEQFRSNAPDVVAEEIISPYENAKL